MEALELPLHAVKENPVGCAHKHVFVGTDCQSALTSFDPLKHPKFGHVDPSIPLQKICSTAVKCDQTCHFQWVPSHISLDANEEADAAAGQHREMFSVQYNQHLPDAPSCPQMDSEKL